MTGRGAANLEERLTRLSALVLDLVRHEVDEAAIEATDELRQLVRARPSRELSPLDRGELEESLQAWLEERGVPEAWEIAGTFADEGLTFAGVEQLPMVMVVANNAWAISTPRERQTHAGTLALLAVGAEFLFRGVAHGVLGRGFRVTHAGGRWLLSVPTAVCALLYTGAGTLLPLAGSPLPLGGPTVHWLSMVAASLLFGLTAGLVRERSGSILAPGLLHLVGLALCEFVA